MSANIIFQEPAILHNLPPKVAIGDWEIETLLNRRTDFILKIHARYMEMENLKITYNKKEFVFPKVLVRDATFDAQLLPYFDGKDWVYFKAGDL